MDRALCLRLGRAPILHEWDIAMPREMHFPHVVGFAGMPTTWFKLATIQGKLYRYLLVPLFCQEHSFSPRLMLDLTFRYSTSALARPSTELIDRAHALAEECRALEIESSKSRNEAVESFEMMQASPVLSTLVRGDEVQLLSTMTLVYRALPPANGCTSTFSQECIDTARKAIGKHQECVGMLNSQRLVKMSYAHW